MLIERSCRQVPGEPFRRWLDDEYFDLIVWGERGQNVVGFQLCYDKPGQERALTWIARVGFTHACVDGGWASPFSMCTPMLVPAGGFPAERVRQEFVVRSAAIEPWVRDMVLTKMEEYSQSPDKTVTVQAF